MFHADMILWFKKKKKRTTSGTEGKKEHSLMVKQLEIKVQLQLHAQHMHP